MVKSINQESCHLQVCSIKIEVVGRFWFFSDEKILEEQPLARLLAENILFLKFLVSVFMFRVPFGERAKSCRRTFFRKDKIPQKNIMYVLYLLSGSAVRWHCDVYVF